MGLSEEVLFESEDLVGQSDRAVNVLTCLLDVARISHNIPVPDMIARERKAASTACDLLLAWASLRPMLGPSRF